MDECFKHCFNPKKNSSHLSPNRRKQPCHFDRFINFAWDRNRGLFWTLSPIRSWSMEPMELKLSKYCCMAIDLSESTECSEIAAKKRDLHHLNGQVNLNKKVSKNAYLFPQYFKSDDIDNTNWSHFWEFFRYVLKYFRFWKIWVFGTLSYLYRFFSANLE
jgi:hypothetical protein